MVCKKVFITSLDIIDMKKISFLILISILGFSVSSCSYFKTFNEKRKEVQEASTPTIKVNAAGKAKAEEDAKKAAEGDSLTKAMDEAEGVKREQDVAGLIKSTNPEVRVRGSVRGRQDPFSTVAVKPKIEIEPEKITENNRNSRGRGHSPVPNNRPSNITSTPTFEDLNPPEVASPTRLAENVLITGLVELGDRIRIIVQAPGEATSRYVDIGQYISNGQVLVKRIESSFPTPTVILEQGGIEVTRVIGQPKAEDIEDQALLPPPPPPSSTSKSLSWLYQDSTFMERE